jgi:L-fuconolactonase
MDLRPLDLAVSEARMEIIDTHPHIFSPASDRYPVAPVGGEQSTWSLGIDLDAEDLVAAMDAAGVAEAVIAQTSTVYGFDNSYLADGVARIPDRLHGICSIDATGPTAAADLRHWVEDRGLVGIRLFSASSAAGELYALDDPRLEPFWAAAAELAVPVDLQVRYAALDVVDRIAQAHPDVVLVLDHIGGAPVATGPFREVGADLFALARRPQVNVKFSGHNLDAAERGPASAREFIAALVEDFGADRVLWGSNFPNTFGALPPTIETYRIQVDKALDAVALLDDTDQRQVMAGTARSVYLSGRAR